LLAGLVRDVALRHQVDSRRIFVAGLSAGAAMKVVLGQTCPELFAGVAAHSGLPYASAHDIPSAMAAMKGGRGATSPGGRSYTRNVQTDAAGTPQIEAWTLHGAGHAWSGGRASGSYTDGTGPDASAEMIRFFLALPRAGTA
jgi:poly(3-hydroxybutyrate) depolymerase